MAKILDRTHKKVCNWVRTSGQWSEEERPLHISVLELLAIKLTLFSFTKRRRVTAIHLQIDNKAALPYLSKIGEKITNI